MEIQPEKMSVHEVGRNPNAGSWTLEDALGNDFENEVYDLVCQELKDVYSKGVRVIHTPRSGDGGKDIIVTSSIPLTFLDQSFHLNGKDRISIYVECKSSDQREVRFEKISSNVFSAQESKPDYFVLATNATISPRSHCRTQEELASREIAFRLVDRYLLANYFKKCGSPMANFDLPVEPDAIYAEYQCRPMVIDGRNAFKLYFVCRNYSDKVHTGSLALQTDRGWDGVDHLEFTMEGFGCCALETTLVRSLVEDIDEVGLCVKTDASTSYFTIASQWRRRFEPCFVGRERELDQLRTWIAEAAGCNSLHLIGETGVGKTRLIGEAYKELVGRTYDFIFLAVKRSCSKVRKDIDAFLVEKGYLDMSDAGVSLAHSAEKSSHYYRRAIIVIDDLHNADASFLDDVQKVACLTSNAPVSFLFCGRSDYDAFNPAYFSHLQWCKDNDLVLPIYKLTPDKTSALVKTLIEGVPDVVHSRICEASDNNPLFVVQFIEYLLEEDIAVVAGRNTIGITNINAFNENDYIPLDVESIYKRRFSYLMTLPEKEDILDFLRVLTELDGSLDGEAALDIFGERLAIPRLLVSRRVIISNGDVYEFAHETLLLFFKKKLLASKRERKHLARIMLGSKFERLGLYDDLRAGKLCYWSGDKDRAGSFFAPYIEQLRSVENVSNLEIDALLFEYMRTIFCYLEEKHEDVGTLKKVITTKIYLALHHLSPSKAIVECDEALESIAANTELASDKRMQHAILAQKAHALMMTGRTVEGEQVLHGLVSAYLVRPDDFDDDALFDIFDRLCIANMKRNNASAAKNYSELSLSISRRKEDQSLEIIAHRTRTKLYFYLDKEEAQASFSHVRQATKSGSYDRIKTCNEIAELLFSLSLDPSLHEEARREGGALLAHAEKRNYGWATTRAYLLLAACGHLDRSSTSRNAAKEHIAKGINACIRFSISDSIWQFYNLLGIVDTALDFEIDRIKKVFLTVHAILKHQKLIQMPKRELCYGSSLALDNVMRFLASKGVERDFFAIAGDVLYGSRKECDYDCSNENCNYVCPASIEELKKAYRKARRNESLLIAQESPTILRDPETGYFIVLA